MRLEDDQYEAAKAPDSLTNAQRVALKQYIQAQVRAAGGTLELGTLMASTRKAPKAPWASFARDEEWIEVAKECQAEWDAKRAAKAEPKAL
jgi:hypothetical protein